MKSKRRFFIEVIICIIIIIFLLSKMDLQKTLEIIKNLNYTWLSLALLLYIIFLLLTAYSLKVLFDAIHFTPFHEWLRFYLVGFSIGLILPGRAGDLSIIYFTKERGFDIGQSTALTITDKIITLSLFGLLAVLSIFTILKSAQLYFGLFLALFCIAIGILSFTKAGRELAKKILGKYTEKFKGFYKTLKELLTNHKDKILINIGITLLRPIGNALLILLIFKAMNLNVSLFYAVLINAVTLIVSLIPLTPNGLGIREGTGAFLFSKLGIPLEASLSMYIIILIMNYSTGIIGASQYLLHKRKTSQ